MDSASPDSVVLLGASSTKGAELEFLRARIEELGCRCHSVDTSLRRPSDSDPDDKLALMQEKAAEIVRLIKERFLGSPRTAYLGVGGGVGTWIALAVMKEIPFGVGKVLVSTLPFDPRPDLAIADVVVVPSIVDLQGLNPILRSILRRGASIACGLAAASAAETPTRPLIAITGLGITTPAVQHCQKRLEAEGFEVATFHANGCGGRAFEHWLHTGGFAGAIDLTTHELNGALFGGAAVADEQRLTSAGARSIPQVVCPGGLDILGRGPLSELSESERSRPHYSHSPKFTHVRATAGEMELAAGLMAERLRTGPGPCAVMIPMGGFSQADHPGSPMWNPAAGAAFVAALRLSLRPSIELIERPDHINSPAFSEALVAKLLSFLPAKK